MVEEEDLEAAIASFERDRATLERELTACELIQTNGGLGLNQYARIKQVNDLLVLKRIALQTRIKKALDEL